MATATAVAKTEAPRAPRRLKDVSVRARDRAADAHRLHIAGQDWSSIAELTGYADARVCAQAVKIWLQKAAVEQGPDHRKHALDLELARLDALQAAWWSLALDGDVKAAGLVLKILAMRCKILGLNGDADLVAQPRALVISGSPEQYCEQLKAIVENDEEAIDRLWPG